MPKICIKCSFFNIPVPPNKPTIFDESGREVRELIGPYLEGDTIVLKCIASGGGSFLLSLLHKLKCQ